MGLALPGLEASGFDPEIPSDAGRQALIVIYALIPVVLKVMAILVVWQFPLTAHIQNVIRQRLRRRKIVETEKGGPSYDRQNQCSDLSSNRSKRMYEYETN